MPFLNGFPTEEDIKLPLYLVEPEQLSDLVAVPDPKNKYWNIQLINNNVVPQTGEQEDIQKVNYPLSEYPCLFQRYNPYGLPFAENYSAKLFSWRSKYSKFYLKQNNTPFLHVDNFQNSEPIILNYSIGNKLEITLPDTGKKLDLSYYYPELNPDDFTIFRTFNDVATVTSETVGDWRILTVSSGQNPVSRSEAYEFRRINNECIQVPVTRSWLLRFETHFCLGQTIEIDEDILISSLVFNYYDFIQSEIDLIINQIPECYFYSYLDTFFSDLDNAISQSNSTLFNWQVATKVKFDISFDYEIDHKINSEEVVEKNPNFYDGSFLVDNSSYLRYVIEQGNKYFITANSPDRPAITYEDFVAAPELYQVGTIIYGNNNNWDNYNFSLEDIGKVQLDKRSFASNPQFNNVVFYKYLGNFDREDGNNRPVNQTVFGLPNYFGDNLLDTFYPEEYPDGLATFGYLDWSAFELRKDLIDTANEVYNNYFARLLFDQAINFPKFTLTVGNDVRQTIYTVDNPRYPDDDIFPFAVRGNVYKAFRELIYVEQTTASYLDTVDNLISPTKEEVTIEDRRTIGELDVTFNKYYQDHPVSQRYEDGQYVPNQYFAGEPTFDEITDSSEKVLQPRINYASETSSGKNVITSVIGAGILNLRQYSLEKSTEFAIEKTFSASYTASFVLASQPKFFRRYDFEDIAFDFIINAHETCYMANCDLEDLKKQVQEIWLTLEAGHYAYREGTEDNSRDWNPGRMIEAIATVLGLSFNSDGSIRSIRQGKLIEQGDSIPAGWNFGQFGRNQGGSNSGQEGGSPTERRHGIAYELRTNTFENDDFTGETNKIKQGGIVLAENIPQLLHFIVQDFDRGLGLQDMGANILPTPNGGQIASYQGINSILLDLLFTLGQMSRQTTGSHILAMKNQAILQEVLSGFGLPVAVKEIDVAIDEQQQAKLPYPGFAVNAPTLNDQNTAILLNLAALIGSKIEVNPPLEEEETEIENSGN